MKFGRNVKISFDVKMSLELLLTSVTQYSLCLNYIKTYEGLRLG